ncbi:MAG: hypothetical protein LBE13_18030 [Bacteroidales bacterium]|nr:hypothetical protein [Bacteroidales bacterium]
MGHAAIIEQTHRFTIGGVYQHLNFIIKCSVQILDQSSFDTTILEKIYTDALNYIHSYFSIWPMDYRPTSKEELMTIKREMNKSLRDNINQYYEEHYAKIMINSVLLWDEGYYTVQLPFTR